ncbi:BMP family lipoprotein [Clostridium thermobutyricum]|uniref:Membrane lipoprotein TmpC n=1 Tax=Clostridium thermobutyricum DSM 4928 TaxID=1121339 RepID=A0A1V4STP5_9CLOT|nr:BMP family protein [Clostridium thermobutyricum]OPX47265.1 membrane lipoprotein TmpC precursor [Clostridium thermobutyricum DSM 4928]
MKKKVIAMAMTLLMATGVLAGCGGASGDDASKEKKGIKVGMVTDSGTIDDKSFNQGTWEGILKAEKDLGVTTQYLKPAGETEQDYLKEITNLYDAGNRVIVAPGFKFETAIYKAQDKYKDAKFVIIDGSPKKDNNAKEGTVADNTVSIFYAEEQSGFLAGVATALEIKEGDLGFIGGLEIPPVQKFNWGFQQGVKYANENFGTKTTLKAENVKYANSFVDTAAGQQLAATMYDRGVKAVFVSAGKVGVGVITEAKTRVSKGETAWVVGVDVDQYADGIYEGDKSVILTSATKNIGKSAYDMIDAEIKGEFPGGKTLTFDIKNDGVGIPEKNPNLSEDTISKVNQVKEDMKADKIKVSAEKGNLIP